MSYKFELVSYLHQEARLCLDCGRPTEKREALRGRYWCAACKKEFEILKELHPDIWEEQTDSVSAASLAFQLRAVAVSGSKTVTEPLPVLGGRRRK